MAEIFFTISGNTLLKEGTSEVYRKWDETSNTSNNNTTNNNNTNNTTTSTETLINQHVTASVSYSNYFFNIIITSTLEEVLPGKTIKYGADFGICDKYGNTNYNTYSMAKKDGNKYRIEFSIFDYDGTYGFYVRQYEGLLEKQKTETLSNDEKSLLNKLRQMLKEQESNIASDFQGRIFVEINGSKYIYRYFNVH